MKCFLLRIETTLLMETLFVLSVKTMKDMLRNIFFNIYIYYKQRFFLPISLRSLWLFLSWHDKKQNLTPSLFLRASSLLAKTDWLTTRLTRRWQLPSKPALSGQWALAGSWHPNFLMSSPWGRGGVFSLKKCLRHFLLRPHPSSRLISFHQLSSDYAVVHFVVSADGERVNDSGVESAPVSPQHGAPDWATD